MPVPREFLVGMFDCLTCAQELTETCRKLDAAGRKKAKEVTELKSALEAAQAQVCAVEYGLCL